VIKQKRKETKVKYYYNVINFNIIKKIKNEDLKNDFDEIKTYFETAFFNNNKIKEKINLNISSYKMKINFEISKKTTRNLEFYGTNCLYFTIQKHHVAPVRSYIYISEKNEEINFFPSSVLSYLFNIPTFNRHYNMPLISIESIIEKYTKRGFNLSTFIYPFYVEKNYKSNY